MLNELKEVCSNVLAEQAAAAEVLGAASTAKYAKCIEQHLDLYHKHLAASAALEAVGDLNASAEHLRIASGIHNHAHAIARDALSRGVDFSGFGSDVGSYWSAAKRESKDRVLRDLRNNIA